MPRRETARLSCLPLSATTERAFVNVRHESEVGIAFGGNIPFTALEVSLMRHLLFVCSLFLSASCFSQTVVVPTDAVVIGVRIHASASTDSADLGLMRPGEQAQYLGEVPRWYRILHPVHGEGLVSKGWTRLVTSAVAAPALAFDVYIVDVGTGLGIFVRGNDFALVYDAGSNDDPSSRFLDFLNRVAPTISTIDYLVISHAHFDHISMLAGLLDAKIVQTV